MTERVVITGLGIVSCLGNDAAAVRDALFNGRSGIALYQDHIDAGMRSQVAGAPQIDLSEHIDRKQWRFMGDAAGYAYLSLQQAIAQAGLTQEQISHPRTGIVAGSGGASSASQVEAADILRDRGIRRVGPYRVTQTMGSTVSACLATPFQIKGVNYSISSACSTSAHCIGHAMELIQLGKQDVMFAGGGEELHWTMSALFDAMDARGDTALLVLAGVDEDHLGRMAAFQVHRHLLQQSDLLASRMLATPEATPEATAGATATAVLNLVRLAGSAADRARKLRSSDPRSADGYQSLFARLQLAAAACVQNDESGTARGDKEVQKLLDGGLIEPCISNWASPVLVRLKKDSTPADIRLKLIIDFRLLNEVTVPDVAGLGDQEEILDGFGGDQRFCGICDAAGGFY